VIIIHGTEIATVAHQNFDRHKAADERIRYCAELGVKFEVCGLAATGLFHDNAQGAGEKIHNRRETLIRFTFY
jgi:predicted peroxiredoxin